METIVTGSFDLNIQKVLEHWSVSHALRELIANALDECALTQTDAPKIFRDSMGRWHIRDFGRGIKYVHFTQNENTEKLKHPELVVGKFGVGLKDALATFDRHKIILSIASKYGTITIGKAAKHGFSDVVTLHAMVKEPTDPQMIGTEIILDNLKDGDMEKAMDFFLAFSGEETLAITKYGHVVKKKGRMSRIYVNGLCVAEEENLLFSYNITSPTKQLLKALNRERTNVGRSAYSDRIKQILLECVDANVADVLAGDLKNLQTGTSHDELDWLDVQLHACKILSAREKVVFVTSYDLMQGGAHIDYAQSDGFRIVVVPENLATKFAKTRDIIGNPIMDLDQYKIEWNDNFSFQFVPAHKLTKSEQEVFAHTDTLIHLLSGHKHPVKEVLISETMRPDISGFDALGVWEPAKRRIIIKRSQLRSLEEFSGTFLHEMVHAISDTSDGTLEFEGELTNALGKIDAMYIVNSTKSKEKKSFFSWK